MVVQRLRIHASTAGGMGLIPGRAPTWYVAWPQNTHTHTHKYIYIFTHTHTYTYICKGVLKSLKQLMLNPRISLLDETFAQRQLTLL